MRTSLALISAFSFVVIGCGPESPDDPAGPVRLMRIMVQDALPNGVRGVAMDLLDTPGSPLTTAVACDAGHPCVSEYTLQHFEPDVACTDAGFCKDPLAAGVAPLTPPERHEVGEAGGTQIRFVFNKLLPANVQAAQAIQIMDSVGKPVEGTTIWDPSGSSVASSDVVITPYGPALVFKPSAPLNASATYTITINASLVTDRRGNAMAVQNGDVVTGTYSKTFTTENLMQLPQTTATKIASGGVTLTPNQIVQLGFNAPASNATACTVTNGGTTVNVVAYADRGADCSGTADTTLVNLAAVDGSGAAVDWAAGDYAVSCTVNPATGGDPVTVTGSFTVSGSPVASDPLARDNHVVCN